MNAELIVSEIKKSEVDLKNAVFKNEISPSDKENINEKAIELLAYLAEKDTVQIREILD